MRTTPWKKLVALCLLIAFPLVGWTQPASEDMSEAEAQAEQEVSDLGGELLDAQAPVGGPSIDTGDTAWILAATALVLFMTIPGLSLFYGGLVRKRNVLSVLMHCFVITCLMSVIWVAFGYTLAFDAGNPVIGGFGKMFLSGLSADDVLDGGTIPEILFFAFQMTFFVITPALMVGAFVERIRFSAVLWFTGLWAILVYLPVCHMVWAGDGWLYNMGVIDLAGGIVVHITAGIGALVACIVIGPRRGYPKTQMLPHNLPMCVMGTGMLWVGWFGFNGGSGLAANGAAAMSVTVTHLSASVAAIVWMAIEWVKHGKPSVLGCVTGAIAGLAAITPASGVVGPVGALCIGALSGAICWWMSTAIKNKFGYDDSLDVFGVHGVGGFLGTILAAVFCAEMFGGTPPTDYSMGVQLGIQACGAFVVLFYTLIVSLILLKGIDKLVGLRVDDSEETEGLDLSAHGESGYNS